VVDGVMCCEVVVVDGRQAGGKSYGGAAAMASPLIADQLGRPSEGRAQPISAVVSSQPRDASRDAPVLRADLYTL